MANYNELKTLIDAYVNRNGVQAITGSVLNGVLNEMVNQLGRGYELVGVALPGDNPGLPDGPVAYVAAESGVYVNFGGYTVRAGEIAMLSYDGYWTKVTLYEGIQDTEATVDSSSGDPQVTVTYSNGTMSFFFSGIRGDQGIQGPPGVTSAVVTVDNTSGIPTAEVSMSGQTLYIDFHGLKGAQGDTGVSADYPITIANNLTTDDPTSALSASMGVQLESEINQVEQDVEEIENELEIARPLFVEKTVITDFSGYTGKDYIVVSGGVYGSASSSKHIEIPVKPGQRIHIVSHATNGTRFAFYWDLDHPGSGAVTPYVSINGSESILLSANTEIIVTVPDGAGWLIVNVGTNSTPYTPQSITIIESKEVSAKEQMTESTEYESANLEDPSKLKAYWAIDSRDGRILRISSSTKGCTDFIPVNGGDLVCKNRTDSGTYGRSAVYDENKAFIRSFNSNTYTYVEGDYYVRFTVLLSSTQPYIIRGNTEYNKDIPFDAPLVQDTFKDSTITMRRGNVPELNPAIGLVGEPGKIITAASLSNDSITITEAPSKLKPNTGLSFYGKISAFGYVELGCGMGNNTGWGLRVSDTSVSAVAYNGGATVIVDTKAHNLTIGTFIYVALDKVGKDINVKVTSFGGEYVGTVSLNNLEAYGTPFAFADNSTSLTDVQFGWVAKDLRKAIWFFGASYCSLYNKRMLTQLRDTYGVDNFAIIAEAGNDFSDIWPSVSAALNFGTPKYLVCAIGMNTPYTAYYVYYLKKMENLCRAKGITLVLCTIPWPENGDKSGINNLVKTSGERYIDLYAAVSADENGTWYPGYCDDGVHPTLIGAKAMAARIMLDLPEILQY